MPGKPLQPRLGVHTLHREKPCGRSYLRLLLGEDRSGDRSKKDLSLKGSSRFVKDRVGSNREPEIHPWKIKHYTYQRGSPVPQRSPLLIIILCMKEGGRILYGSTAFNGYNKQYPTFILKPAMDSRELLLCGKGSKHR